MKPPAAALVAGQQHPGHHSSLHVEPAAVPIGLSCRSWREALVHEPNAGHQTHIYFDGNPEGEQLRQNQVSRITFFANLGTPVALQSGVRHTEANDGQLQQCMEAWNSQ